MHISIQNLGPVKNGEFNLKPLTVFIGDNRQGKTQALYTTYSFLDLPGCAAYATDYLTTATLTLPEFETYCEELIIKGNTSIDLIQYFTTHGQEYLNNLSAIIPTHIHKLLGASEGRFSNLKINYHLSAEDNDRIKNVLLPTPLNTEINGVGIKLIKEEGKADLILYKTKNFNEKIPPSEIKAVLLLNIFGLFHTALYKGVNYLPSERCCISVILQMIANLGLIKTKEINGNTLKSTDFQETINAMQGISFPIQEYIATLYSLLYDFKITEDRNKLTTPKDIQQYEKLADLLTEKIMGDSVTLKLNKAGTAKKISVETNGKDIDISLASSGVKGLMGLVLILRYLSTKGKTIIIDEPEENLHPTQQAALAEFLAILVNSGINVAITTHSPYIVEHLETLILTHGLKDKTGVKEKLILKREDAYIAKEKVSCCLFKDGSIENILLGDGQINWQTFCDTADIVDDVSIFVNYLRESEKEDKNVQSIDTAVAEEKGEYHN